ncbi:protein-L-isoaspartate(D-aspartate) O-methyltransferase [Streptacidiphilus sp. BW17]|uniref:methyltransferase, FxLD system n=1 Tax=Streptacidiphilus sp. BW17 TaxID=3156274 RepID=UPI0035134BED
MTSPATSNDVEQLREQLIRRLVDLDAIRSPRVERAIRAVPRHLFVPEDEPEMAYEAERALVTKRDENGVSLSSISAARIQAMQLEQARVKAGNRVLEVGSGGVNAAYLYELAVEEPETPDEQARGEVTTIDIDPDVVERARKLLPAAGYGHVRALVADAAHGVPEHAPYNRIVITVEAPDLSVALVDQLDATDARMVLPLRLRGLTRSLSFTREGDHLVARDPELCGFVPMRGDDAQQQTLLFLHNEEGNEVGLRLDHPTVEVDGDALRAAFAGPKAESWSGFTIESGKSYDPLDLWLATALDGYARLTATAKARKSDLVAAWSPMGLSALVWGGTSFAYMALRQANEERSEWEFGAVGHGPAAQEAADRLTAEMGVWDREHRGQLPEIRAYRAGTPDAELAAGRVVDRRNFRFTISWPKSS